MKVKIWLCFPIILCTFLQCANAVDAQSKLVMGTLCTIDLYEDGNAALYERLFARLTELEKIFSANREDSELAVVNQNAGLRAVEISPELFTVLERAIYFAQATNGAFDPTIGPLVKLWGIGKENAGIPADDEIISALELVNYKDLELSSGKTGRAGTAFLKRQGMSLDLGAIAKGYAADELVLILREAGVKRAIIDLGGNIYVWGKKPNGEPWRIGVQDPYGERGTYAGVLQLEDSISVVSSGVYERYFIGNDGRQYHHILELSEDGRGRRGYPVDNNILSTTVIAASSMDADALSTSCFVLGYEKGLDLAKKNGTEVLYIMEENVQKDEKMTIKINGSPGIMAIFTH